MAIAGLNIEIPNPNHPKLGDTIKVEPIRTVNAINKLKQYLAPSPRNLALFVVGINTAYRASELLSIRLGQVRHLRKRVRSFAHSGSGRAKHRNRCECRGPRVVESQYPASDDST